MKEKKIVEKKRKQKKGSIGRKILIKRIKTHKHKP